MTTVYYDVTFMAEKRGKIQLRRTFIACVRAVKDSGALRAYHLLDGEHLVPDYAAIRAALPHYHRKAFDRAGPWWFPLTLHSALSTQLDWRNAASLALRDSKGRPLGVLFATPYMFDCGAASQTVD